MSLSVRRALAPTLLGAALAIGVSACGSSVSTSTTALAGAATSSSARYQGQLNLAKCLRAHGLNVPDPSPTGERGAFRALQQYSQAQIQSALSGCRQYVRNAFAFANLSPAQQAQFRQQFVRFAECMRAHGINIPDPTTTAGGGFGIRRALGSVDRNSPAFQAANQACSSLRPRLGRNGPGGPGGPPPAGSVPGA